MRLENAEDTSKARVLIVEDELGIGLLYEATLNNSTTGFQAVVKNTPEQGLADFEANKDIIHLVVVDQRLPGMSGEVLAQEIRQRSGRVDDPYIIMVTGTEAVLLNPKIALDMGVNEVVAKPFSPRDLVAKLTQASQRFQTPRS